MMFPLNNVSIIINLIIELFILLKHTLDPLSENYHSKIEYIITERFCIIQIATLYKE